MSHTIKPTPMIRAGIAALLIAMSVQGADAEITRSEKSFGPKVSYIGQNTSVGAGLFFQYSFSRHFRVAPEIGIVFRNRDRDALTIDLNAHVPFGFKNDKVAIYPLAGLNFASWSLHGNDENSADDVTTHINRIGLNTGAGVELRCTRSLKLTLEGKYTFIKSYSGAVVSLGISYVF